MNWQKVIEIYVGHSVNFFDDYTLYENNNGEIIIETWNIKEKTKPTVQQLEQIWAQYGNEIEAAEMKERIIAENKERLFKKYIESELKKEGILNSDGTIKGAIK